VVQQIDPIYVDVAQASTEVLGLRNRMESGHLQKNGTVQNKVKLYLDDNSAYPIEGTLQFRDVTVDPTTGSITLRMVFSNPKHILLPGMFVRAVVQEGISHEALLAPQQGITRNTKGIPIAWVVNKDEKVEQRVLELDRAIGDKWLVTSGLVPGDRLIVDGLQRVRPGMPVKALPFTNSGRSTTAETTPDTPQPNAKGGSHV
jgi:membrane fusion protein (multidrug efflux system)